MEIVRPSQYPTGQLEIMTRSVRQGKQKAAKFKSAGVQKNRRNKSAVNSKVKIIAGKWRGRQVAFTAFAGLRPTLNHLRETLFNWLQMDIHGACCLDMYAGSGALGLEALSRGAKEVVFVDRHPAVITNLKENLVTLSGNNGQVVCQDSMHYLAIAPGKAFDIIFLDPPFSQDLLTPCCMALERYQRVAKGSLIYVEAECSWPKDLPDNWKIIKEKSTSQVVLYLCRVE